MTVELIRNSDWWSGIDEQVEFKIRPCNGTLEGDSLLENVRYRLVVKIPEPILGFEVQVGGLPFEMTSENGIFFAEFVVQNTFGLLCIKVFQDGSLRAQSSINVKPKYLDVETDFVRMKADIDQKSLSLAYAIWRLAHQRASPDFTVPQGTVEWLAMLRHGWAQIKRTLQEIARDPNTELVRLHEVVRAERAVHVDSRGMRWLAQHPSAWASSQTPLPVVTLHVAGRYITPERVLVVRREVSLNTPANRALKHALTCLEGRLHDVLQKIGDLSSGHFAASDKAAYVDQLKQILRESQHYTIHGFLRDVAVRAPRSSQPIHVARADVRYRQVFRLLEVLQWGVVSDVGGRVTEMSLKDTWELYEYWVYLFVLGLFVSWGWDCIVQGALVVAQPSSSILLELPRGKASQSQFCRVDQTTGQHAFVTLAFHREFSSRRDNPGLGRGALTVTRNVDILLEVVSAGKMRRLVLDPKYRADVSGAGGHLTCPQAAVDDMHVYRDAIGRWEMGTMGARHFVRTLDAAIAVFPSHDEASAKSSLFYESLQDGIGALPLLPSLGPGPFLLPRFIQEFVS